VGRYADYKDSGLSYLPNLPSHWERTHLKRVLAVPITDGPHETPEILDEGVPFLSAEAVKDLGLNFDLKRGYISEDDHKRFCKKCKPQYGDIFMVKSGATTGNIAMVTTHDEFSVWSPLALIRYKPSVIRNDFLFQLLQAPVFRMQVELFWSYGTQQNIGMKVLGNQYVILPPMAEQLTIATYLDRRTAEIDSLLADLQIQVEKLDLYKRELITNTITHGLNKSAPRKESGVNWIGEIPTTWDLLPLYAVAKENKVKNDGMVCENLLSLSYGRIIPKDIDSAFGLLPASFEGYQIVQPGYTVMRLTDLQNDKRSLRTGYATETGIITSAYMGLIPGEKLDGKYFNYLLHAYDLLKIYYGLGSGLRQTLNFSDMKRLPVLMPPMPEQKAIVAYIDNKTSQINGLIADINEQTEKLKQYRQIVIHDAATGKIKVTEG